MSGDRWRPIASARFQITDENRPILLSDGENVWLGYWEPNGRYLYAYAQGAGGGWTDGVPGHWTAELVRCLEPTHWKPCPRPSPKPRTAKRII